MEVCGLFSQFSHEAHTRMIHKIPYQNAAIVLKPQNTYWLLDHRVPSPAGPLLPVHPARAHAPVRRHGRPRDVPLSAALRQRLEAD
eukprot:722195-Hanusia_phi.AAC.1